MTVRKKLLGEWIGRLTKVAMSEPEANAAVQAELAALRARIPQLIGSLVASGDGLLVAHDLPSGVEAATLAAITASQLALSYRLVTTALGGDFHEVVVGGAAGHVVIYAAGWTALTVLAGPEITLGRIHLEARPTAHAIADHLAVAVQNPPGKHHVRNTNGKESA